MLMLRQKPKGFTIVELLIVIVVIAILATISIIAYTGIQVRARDSMRTDSIAKIKKALELYKIDNGWYPWATANPGASGWEVSTDTAGTFMEYLKSYGFSSGVPVDPTNDATYRIYYYKYSAGDGGCDPVKGEFYVLHAYYESAANKPTGNSMATECSSPNGWWSESSTHYAFHAYQNP